MVRRGNRNLDRYVRLSIFALICYTVAEFVTSYFSGATHDVLTTCFYACFGGEILSCALIKIFKLKGEGDG